MDEILFHNRKRNRLQNYDYSTPEYYFVTICTQGMLEYFGGVQNSEMKLNVAGRIATDRINWLENHFEYIKIIKFVVMPNHVHIIIQIIDVNVGTTRELSLRKIKPISELVGAFKTTSSKLIHQYGLNGFQWQRSFYDHIIRNDEELSRISDYIEKNPLLWKQDVYLI